MNAYDNGILAAKDGQEHWENPHASVTSTMSDFHQWYAGWCYGMQIRYAQPLEETTIRR
jgi:hypothetical protein